MSDIAFVCGFLVALKLCFLRCYVSTDFEVHRNWLAITYNLPLSKWYFEDTSIWTLDYPPFFAYFELFLSYLASLFDKDILIIQKDALLTPNVLLFQRLSVIFSDIVFYIGCYSCANAVVSSLNIGAKKSVTLRNCLFILLALNPALILLDNVHFQYNSMLFGIFLLGIRYFLKEDYVKAALVFSILLNCKHIFLYYVFAFVLGFAFWFLLPVNRKIMIRVVSLGAAVVLPVAVSFGPFLFSGGLAQFHQILSRLFPFKRGLTHSYWAPNFWALYNTLDFMLFKLKGQSGVIPPTYTNGLVQTYDHSVLPNIAVECTLALVAIFSIVLFFVRGKSRGESFLAMLIMSAFSFFLFSWHVHEKAAVLIQIPITILAFVNPCYASICLFCTQASIVGLFPLFFDKPIENLIKYGLYIGYVFVFKTIFSLAFNLRDVFDVKNKVFFLVTALLEFYKGFLHKSFLGNRADFLPLMSTSLICSSVLIYVYLYLLMHFTRLNVIFAKICLRFREVYYKKYSSSCVPKPVTLIGALDMTQNVNIPALSTVSYCIFTYPDLKLHAHEEKTVIVKYDYITNYLALRECNPLVDIVNQVKERPHVLFIDGNARLHARDFGLGCHVESLTGIPTVGIAKKLSASFGRLCDDSQYFQEWLKSRDWSKSRILEVVKDKVRIFRVIKLHSNLYFISAGLKTELGWASEVSCRGMSGGNFQPLRVSDLCSRHLNQDMFTDASLRL
ncbi:unnamed protein product [Bursaphelenchus xylophilus]|uniref:Alpha-1,3-glucosyltransferase n=1 Tax=Bursaphelenchus xylophilus TaxID=6326 RepID=A0A1I7SMW0_BURXY|nr:unnamed protein product [Bursaphelenchus xylophilus]CAG9130418.1 unnamed protein product [Bursaphelenchus xylophilus]